MAKDHTDPDVDCELEDLNADLQGPCFEVAKVAEGWLLRRRPTFVPAIRVAADVGGQDLDLREFDVAVLAAVAYTAFASALLAALKKLGNLYEFRNLVLLGTAIPNSFAKLAKGSDEIPRHDWLFFKALKAAMPSGMRQPIYGDHTIVHPEFTAMDMRK